MKNIHWIGIIAALLIIFSIDKCSTGSRIDNLIDKVANYDGAVDSFRLSNNALIASNESLKLETQEQIESLVAKNDTLSKMIKKFKQVQNVTNITNNFLASGDSANFDKPIPCDFKPFPFTISTKSFTLEQTISNKGSKIDKLFIPNEVKIVYGTKRKGLFKTEHYVDVNNSNEMITASNIKNFTFSPKKKWFERPIVVGLIGAGAGFVGGLIVR